MVTIRRTVTARLKTFEEECGVALLESFTSAEARLRWKCMQGHEFDSSWNTLRKLGCCPACSKLKRQARDRLEVMDRIATFCHEIGVKLLEEYTNSDARLRWKCMQGHEFAACWRHLQIRTQCPNCAKDPAHLMEDILHEFTRKHQIQLLSPYTKASDYLQWQCIQKKHEFTARWKWLQRHPQCPKCYYIESGHTEAEAKSWHDDTIYRGQLTRKAAITGTKPINQLHIAEYLAAGYKVIQELPPKRGNKTYLVDCGRGHQYSSLFTDFNRGSRCRRCYEMTTVTVTESQVCDELAARGYKLIGPYLNTKKPVRVECPNGHQYEALFHTLKRSGCNRCRYDGQKNPEELVREALAREGYELAGKYVTRTSGLEVICPNRHRTIINYMRWSDGKRCSICRVERIQSKVNEIRTIAASMGYTLLSESYLNQKTPLRWKENASHRVFTASWEGFYRNGYRGLKKPFDMEAFERTLFTKGLEIEEFRDSRKVRLRCKKAGHRYSSQASTVRKSRGCPYCNNFATLTLEEVQKRAAVENYRVTSRNYINRQQYLDFECPKGHKYRARWSYFHDGDRCPECSRGARTSRPEREIIEVIQNAGITNVLQGDRTIFGTEVDVLIPDRKIGIEYCGLYFHHEGRRGKDHHHRKMKTVQEKGYQLLTVFEDEWISKRPIVEAYILQKLGVAQKLYARHCELRAVENPIADRFLDENHLFGRDWGAKKAWGLYHPQHDLVGVITLGPHHRRPQGAPVLKRLGFRRGFQVVGGASKLFGPIMATESVVVSYADLRYSQGKIYEKLGFTLLRELGPDYSYVQGQKRFGKQSLKKNAEEKLSGKTEFELRDEMGFLRIWDCGKKVYLWRKPII